MTAAAGHWILIDMLNKDQYGLLSIGKQNFSGASARKRLDPLSRELLMDRIRRVLETAKPVRESVLHRGNNWDVVVEPLFAPINRVVIGARAVYVHSGQSIPERPLVGAIEWKIMDGGTRIETVWNDDMFEIYGIPRSGAGSATGDMSQWIASLIAPEDRARMKVVIDGGIAAPDGQRHMVAYRILSGTSTGVASTKHLEASGRVFDGDQNSVKWLRGITREVSEMAPANIPNNVDIRSAGILRAAFELTPRDTALLAVDTLNWQIFMTSPTWADMDLRTPSFGYLPHVIHPDDLNIFLARCENSRATEAAVLIRVLHNDGSYRGYAVAASDGHFGDHGHQRYIVVSLTSTATDRRLEDRVLAEVLPHT